MTELHRQTAGELAASIKKGDVSSTEVVKAYLDRLDKYDGLVNAVVTRNDDDAMDRAGEADKAMAKSECRGLQLVGQRWHDEELLSIARLFAEIAGPIGTPRLFT